MGQKKKTQKKTEAAPKENVGLDALSQAIEAAEKEVEVQENKEQKDEVKEQKEPSTPKEEDKATDEILSRYEERMRKFEEKERELELQLAESEKRAESAKIDATNAKREALAELERAVADPSSLLTDTGSVSAEIMKIAPELMHHINSLKGNFLKEKVQRAPVKKDTGDACGPCDRTLTHKIFRMNPGKNPYFELDVTLEDFEKEYCKTGRKCDVYTVQFKNGRAQVPAFIGQKLVAMKPRLYECS